MYHCAKSSNSRRNTKFSSFSSTNSKVKKKKKNVLILEPQAGFAPTVDSETKILEHVVLFGKQSKET